MRKRTSFPEGWGALEETRGAEGEAAASVPFCPGDSDAHPAPRHRQPFLLLRVFLKKPFTVLAARPPILPRVPSEHWLLPSSKIISAFRQTEKYAFFIPACHPQPSQPRGAEMGICAVCCVRVGSDMKTLCGCRPPTPLLREASLTLQGVHESRAQPADPPEPDE